MRNRPILSSSWPDRAPVPTSSPACWMTTGLCCVQAKLCTTKMSTPGLRSTGPWKTGTRTGTTSLTCCFRHRPSLCRTHRTALRQHTSSTFWRPDSRSSRTSFFDRSFRVSRPPRRSVRLYCVGRIWSVSRCERKTGADAVCDRLSTLPPALFSARRYVHF